MKKNMLILMIGLLVCMLAGCGEAKEPETADEALEQIESEIEEMIAEEEAEEEAFREQPLEEYVPGTIPPGVYVYTYVTEDGIEDTKSFYFFEDQSFNFSNEGLSSHGNVNYTYNEETDLYTFDWQGSMASHCYSYTGRYEDGTFILLSMTYIGPADHPDANEKNYDASTSETEPDGRVYVRQ
ncbi:MAG: hypothetical protein E7285_06725 [Lachnospiraceae bacterium]|nr:hypothetical protein [Lachnospiraceae bacterium]